MYSCKGKIKNIRVPPCNLSAIVYAYCIFCGWHPEVEFSAWDTDFPGCAQHLPANSTCGIWSYSKSLKVSSYPGTVIIHTSKKPEKNSPKNPKQKNPKEAHKNGRHHDSCPKTYLLMCLISFFLLWGLLSHLSFQRCCLGGSFLWIWFLFLSICCSLKLHFSWFPSSNESWNSLF